MGSEIKDIPITIKNPTELLNLVAEGYKSLPKALMEYIDNAFDSAEEFFNEELQKYERDVSIIITIDRKKNKISVRDNCEGMNDETLEGLANSINESQKKRKEQKRAWVNGKFGLGAHAFRFFAKELFVTSKPRYCRPASLSINRENPSAKKFASTGILFDPSGTLVELIEIDKQQMKNLKAEDLKKYAEKYFEMLLTRNVQIVIYDDLSKYICEPFDYDNLAGLEIKKVIGTWKEGDTTIYAPEGRKIFVNLKICTDVIDRPPYFSRKGRIINQISKLDSFLNMTTHRKKVWESFYLTGYIEVQESLEPVMTRDDFLGGKGQSKTRSGVYTEIIKLEDEIFDAIETINKDKNDESLKNLASALTDLLSKITKEEEMNLKYQNSGEDLSNRGRVKFDPDENGDEIFKIGKGTNNKSVKKRGSEEDEVRGNEGEEGSREGEKQQREKQGVRIEFSTLDSTEVRSHYGDGEITIFTTHPDFDARKGYTNKGELGSMKITARLANYLAAVISSEFKEVFYKQKRLEPDRKAILEEQVDFIFRFEEMMKGYIDQPLDSIGNFKEKE
jgi:hypothetical protein